METNHRAVDIVTLFVCLQFGEKGVFRTNQAGPGAGICLMSATNAFPANRLGNCAVTKAKSGAADGEGELSCPQALSIQIEYTTIRAPRIANIKLKSLSKHCRQARADDIAAAAV